MPDEESGVRVTCQEEDTEVRKEHNVCRKWQTAQGGLRAGDECGG